MIHSSDPDPGKDGPALGLFVTNKNTLAELNEKFEREANEYDKDILKRYDDLNTTLIFVSDS